MSINIDTDNESNYPNYSSFHYKLEISKKLKELDNITFFAIDTRTNSIVIEFNHKYQPKTKKVIGPVDINNWSKFSDRVVKELVSSLEIDRREAILVKGNLDQEYDNIVDIVLANRNKNNNLSGISDIYDNVNYNNKSINKNFLNRKQQSQQEEQQEEESAAMNLLD